MPLYRASKYRVLGASAVAVSGGADTNENALATITIPAGAMGLNGILRVTAEWSCTNNANVKTVRHRFSAIGGTAFGSVNLASQGTFRQQFHIANRGAANSQIGVSGSGGGWNVGAGQVTSAVDTTAATTLVITAQKATAGDTFTLESYLVELILP